MKCNDIQQAVNLCFEAGRGCYLVKSDMKSAFRNLPIRPEDWKWLVLMAIHPLDRKKNYFIDNVVLFPYGC